MGEIRFDRFTGIFSVKCQKSKGIKEKMKLYIYGGNNWIISWPSVIVLLGITGLSDIRPQMIRPAQDYFLLSIHI